MLDDLSSPATITWVTVEKQKKWQFKPLCRHVTYSCHSYDRYQIIICTNALQQDHFPKPHISHLSSVFSLQQQLIINVGFSSKSSFLSIKPWTKISELLTSSYPHQIPKVLRSRAVSTTVFLWGSGHQRLLGVYITVKDSSLCKVVLFFTCQGQNSVLWCSIRLVYPSKNPDLLLFK